MEELIVEPLKEYYEIKTADNELHVINVMLESLQAHLHNNGSTTSEEYEAALKIKRERVVRYVLERVMTQ